MKEKNSRGGQPILSYLQNVLPHPLSTKSHFTEIQYLCAAHYIWRVKKKEFEIRRIENKWKEKIINDINRCPPYFFLQKYQLKEPNPYMPAKISKYIQILRHWNQQNILALSDGHEHLAITKVQGFLFFKKKGKMENEERRESDCLGPLFIGNYDERIIQVFTRMFFLCIQKP